MSKKVKKKIKRTSSIDPQLEVVRERIRKFLAIGETKKIAVISDNDQDGITSSVQLKKYFESKKIVSEVFFYDHYSKKLSIPVDEFIRFSPEKTVFLDLSDGLVSDALMQVGKHTGPFLVVDHHQSEPIKNDAFHYLVVKPWSFSKIEPSKYPTTKMVADLFAPIDWICSIGIVGDFAFEQWASVLDKVKKKYKLKQKDLFNMDETVGCVSAQYSERINTLFEFLCSAKSPKDLLKSEFYALKILFDKKLVALQERFDNEAECYPEGVCFFRADPRFSSKLSNNISTQRKNTVVIIFELPGSLMKCSIRRQDFKVNCGDLAKQCTLGLVNGKGGGHIPAAGATFAPQELNKFKTKVREYLLKNPAK
jgi:single-stranded DNA-specific DHH superfamily exonuclease